MVKSRVIGGYGSAGCGNHSGIRTSTRVGVGATATERNRRTLNLVPVARLDEPPRDELLQSIKDMRCWWCGRTKNKDGKPFKSLSLHWKWAHDIDAQWVRDYLGLTTKESFICEETRQKFVERGKRDYDATKLRIHAGCKKRLTTVFLESQNRKIDEYRQKIGEEKFHQQLLDASRKSAEKSTKSNTCIICGKVFTRKGAVRAKTCSRECDSVRRKKFGQRYSMEYRKSKKCSYCGKEFIPSSRRLTCSNECAHSIRSEKAKAATWKLDRARAASSAKRNTMSPRVCDVEGCVRPHKCRGLCSMHYQRQRTKRDKESNERVTPSD